MRKVVVCFSALFLFVGCAGIHNLQTTPSVSLNQGNFRMIRPVQAEEKAVYVFGIGGMSKDAKQGNAMDKLFKQANLEQNQAIAFINTRKNTHLYFPLGAIVTTVTTVASGWVVEFAGPDGKFSEGAESVESHPAVATPSPTQKSQGKKSDKKRKQSSAKKASFMLSGNDYGSCVFVKDKGSLEKNFYTFEAACRWMQEGSVKRMSASNFEKLCEFVSQTALDKSPEYSEKVAGELKNLESKITK